MSALLVAIFEDFGRAERTRTALVHEGFPTDRVELTACCEPGRAGLEPADSLHGKLVQYFGIVLAARQLQGDAERLTQRLEGGAAAITVQPRGAIETAQARRILADAGAIEIVGHDLLDHGWEHAAARREGPWVRNFLPTSSSHADCIYCRLFEPDLN